MGNEQNEKKGFFQKIKDFFKRLKEENAGFAATMKRINSSNCCGDVNRKVKDGDFWNGSYISIEGTHAVIYGSNQADYTFEGKDVESFTVQGSAQISRGNGTLPGMRYVLKLKDGKTAYVDLIVEKTDFFKNTLGL